MIIKGFEKTTLIDYPGSIASIIFTGGCNFRCDYCYNKDLVLHPEKYPSITVETVIQELEKRKNFIDGIVITGGEPTLQPDLLEFIATVRKLGLTIKLDTNGYRPEVLTNLLRHNVLDYVAMDIKSPLGRYHEIVGIPIKTDLLQESIHTIMHAGIDYEFRTTVWADAFSHDDFIMMLEHIKGARAYYIQNMYPHFSCKPRQNYKPMARADIEPILTLSTSYVKSCSLRGTW